MQPLVLRPGCSMLCCKSFLWIRFGKKLELHVNPNFHKHDVVCRIFSKSTQKLLRRLCEGCVCYLNLSVCHRRPLLHHQHLHMDSADFSLSVSLSCFTPFWFVKSWQGGFSFFSFLSMHPHPSVLSESQSLWRCNTALSDRDDCCSTGLGKQEMEQGSGCLQPLLTRFHWARQDVEIASA